MTAGRCAGCGKVDPSCKKIKTHVMACRDYLDLYKTNPSAALDPETEYDRWKLEEESTKESRRDERIAGYRKESRAKSAAQQTRWTGAASAETFDFDDLLPAED